MAELQDVFNRIKKLKKERSKIAEIYRDGLQNSKPYQDLLEQMKALKEKKASMESQIKAEFQSEIAKLENMKENLKNDTQLMSDIALSSLMKGETVEITDEYETKYEPVFNVKFKKQQ